MLQVNDPDWYYWIPIYLYVCILYGMALYGIRRRYLIYLGMLVYLAGIILYIPDIINWFNLGTPSIVGSMEDKRPYIELTREFFGLVLCLLAMIFLFVPMKKNHKTE
jgi:hypothetical protein